MIEEVEPQNNVTNHMDTKYDDSDDEREKSSEDTKDDCFESHDDSDDNVPLYREKTITST